jgi:phosphatidylserine decarboxylase
MATPLNEWLKSPEVKSFQEMSQKEASHEFFFRNPPRTMWGNRDLFSCPADGVITTQGKFSQTDKLIDVKGVKITLNEILGVHAIDSPALVTAIFMTAADVHWNRMPTDAVVTRYPMPQIRTTNAPMLWTERGLLDSGLIRKGTFGFMTDNSRVVNRCFCGHMNYTYWLVQIADSDVNCIVPIKEGRVTAFNQNERLGQIIWGSMCVLILPADRRFKFKFLEKIETHVCAGVDPLVSVERVR